MEAAVQSEFRGTLKKSSLLNLERKILKCFITVLIMLCDVHVILKDKERLCLGGLISNSSQVSP